MFILYIYVLVKYVEDFTNFTSLQYTVQYIMYMSSALKRNCVEIESAAHHSDICSASRLIGNTIMSLKETFEDTLRIGQCITL